MEPTQEEPLLPSVHPTALSPHDAACSPPCPTQLLVRKARRDISIYRRIKCPVLTLTRSAPFSQEFYFLSSCSS